MTDTKKPESLRDEDLDASIGGAGGMHSLAQLSQLKTTTVSHGAQDDSELQNDLALTGKIRR